MGFEKGKLEGRLEGKEERNIEIAKSMLFKGYSIEDIVFLTGLSRSQIHALV